MHLLVPLHEIPIDRGEGFSGNPVIEFSWEYSAAARMSAYGSTMLWFTMTALVQEAR
jgi:hypothetical protein